MDDGGCVWNGLSFEKTKFLICNMQNGSHHKTKKNENLGIGYPVFLLFLAILEDSFFYFFFRKFTLYIYS